MASRYGGWIADTRVEVCARRHASVAPGFRPEHSAETTVRALTLRPPAESRPAYFCGPIIMTI